MHRRINTHNAPEAIGPYSQAVDTGNMLFVSGQIPLDPETGKIHGEDITGQTQQVLKNLLAILKAAGYSAGHVVKTTCYLKSMNDFTAMNTIYADTFGEVLPARAAVEVARLPKDVLVEIDAIAVK